MSCIQLEDPHRKWVIHSKLAYLDAEIQCMLDIPALIVMWVSSLKMCKLSFDFDYRWLGLVCVVGYVGASTHSTVDFKEVLPTAIWEI